MAYRVQLHGTEHCFEVGAEESILTAALRANVNLAHDCQLGGCGTCRVKLVQGAVSYAEFPLALTPEEAAEGYALACQALPTSDLVISPSQSEIEMASTTRASAVVRSILPASPLVTHLHPRNSGCGVADLSGGAVHEHHHARWKHSQLFDGLKTKREPDRFSHAPDRWRQLHRRSPVRDASGRQNLK